MSNHEWEPVEELDEATGGEWEFIFSAETPMEISRLVDVKLPDGFAVCRRVEPEPITATALAQEGWIMDSFANEAYMPLDDEREIRVDCNSGAVTHKGIAFPGVKGMPQLRALVEMLQG